MDDQSWDSTQTGPERLSAENPKSALDPRIPRRRQTLDRRHARLPRPVEPFELLLAERASFPLLGREAEMAALRSWLESSPPVSARCLSGPSGIGKTRLALALCQWAETSGWSVGFAEADGLPDVTGGDRATASHRSVLVVLEEPGEAIASVARWLGEAGAPRMRATRLRLLLLARDAEAGSVWLDGLARAGVTVGPSRPVCLSGLATPAGAALFARALDEADRLTNRSGPKSSLLTVPEAASPLYLILAGLAGARIKPGHALTVSAASLAHDVASLERARLERLASTCFLSTRMVPHLAACVTLQAGCGLDQAAALVQDEARAMGFHLPLPADQVVDCLADALLSDCGTAIAPIRPELVGGAFVIAELARNPADVQEAIVMRALRRNTSATSRVLLGMVANHAGNDSSGASLPWARPC